MRVRAKAPVNGSEMYGVGYYDLRLYRGGEEFALSDPKHFSERWMEKIVDPPAPEPVVQFVEVEVEKESKKKR